MLFNVQNLILQQEEMLVAKKKTEKYLVKILDYK